MFLTDLYLPNDELCMAEHANDENPFSLFVSIATPHFPHGSAPQEYKDLYPKDKLKLLPNVPKE